ncbi:MAG TPA: hypothetical protein VNG53_11975, partial [Bacteroidia bacterium]|nr:hypothetical protein [Bacteroidia bacterium]
ASKNDSLHIQLFGGTSLSTYYSNKVKISKNPIGYKFGCGISKELKNNFIFNSNISFQNISFTGIKTSIYDQYYYENVTLTTDINFKQLCLSVEVNKCFSKVQIGVNTGIDYLIKSNTSQDVEGGTGLTALNIYDTHAISDYQKDSFYNTINPFLGISFSYFPSKKFGVRYENKFDILPSPSMNYQYFGKIYTFVSDMELIFKSN